MEIDRKVNVFFQIILNFCVTLCAALRVVINLRAVIKMNRILEKQYFSPKVVKLVVEAPLIARSRKPGHFVIVRAGERGERIPLTIADADTTRGTITLVVQAVGHSTTRICGLEPGQYLTDVVGPLGRPTHVEKFGTVACAGGGVGVAPLLPIIKAMKQAGNTVISILAARTAELVILQEEVERWSDRVIVMTDDGSAGTRGLVTDGIEMLVAEGVTVDQAVVIGPAIMMKSAALTTAKYNIPTMCSLNTVMVDGTGMCGACRVTVGGKTRFVCVDGPEFDAHQVDFDEMMKRLRQ